VISYSVDSIYPSTLNGVVAIVDSLGNKLREKVYPTPDYIAILSIIPQTNGDIVFVGEANFNIYNDVYALRTDSMLNAPPLYVKIDEISVPADFELYQNHPNPFNSVTKIRFDIKSNVKGDSPAAKSNVKIAVFDVLGREITTVVNEVLQPGVYETSWDASDYPSGIYFYQLVTHGYSKTKKMILLK